MLAARAPTLDDFCGDTGARVADFFALWNFDLPDSLVAINEKICNKVMMVHGRTRFASWFRLPYTTMDQLINEAFQGNDGGEGWRKTIEDLAGFHFAAPSAPESAALPAARLRSGGMAEEPPWKHSTVALRLHQTGMLTEARLSEKPFEVIVTEDPLHNTISEPELVAFTDAFASDIAAQHGDFAIGLTLARILGLQAKKRLPHLPDRGATPGKQRDLSTMIYNKLRNFKYVRRLALPCLPPCVPPHALHGACATETQDLQKEAEGCRH